MSSEKKTSFLSTITSKIKIIIFQFIVRWVIIILGFATLPLVYISLLYTAILHKNPTGFFQFLKPQKEKPAIFQYYGDDVEFKNKNITLHGKKIGDNSKELILFLHGFPDFWFSWRKQIDVFKGHYLCIAINQRGFYPSTAPLRWSSYRLDELVEDVKCVIEQTGKTKAIIISHDWGAVVLYHFLLKYPNYVTKYVALSIPPNYAFKFNIFQFIKSWYMYFFQLPLIPQYYLKSFNADMKYFSSLTNGLPIDEKEVYQYFFSQKGVFRGPVNYYRANLPTVFGYYFFSVPDLQQRPFPKGLLIHGDMDRFLSVVSFLYANRVPNLRVKSFLHDSHWAHVRDDRRVNYEIDNFLKEGEIQSEVRSVKNSLQPTHPDGKLTATEDDSKIIFPGETKPTTAASRSY